MLFEWTNQGSRMFARNHKKMAVGKIGQDLRQKDVCLFPFRCVIYIYLHFESTVYSIVRGPRLRPNSEAHARRHARKHTLLWPPHKSSSHCVFRSRPVAHDPGVTRGGTLYVAAAPNNPLVFVVVKAYPYHRPPKESTATEPRGDEDGSWR